MVRVYFDVEAYRPNEGEFFVNEKVIAIGYIEDRGELPPRSSSVQLEPVVLIAKDGDSCGIIRQFYDYLKRLRKRERFIEVVGFNILRFDIPLLVQEGVECGVDKLENLNRFWHDIYTKDLRQVFLPFNDSRFKGLTLENLRKCISEIDSNIPPLCGKGEDVPKYYSRSEFDKIEKHLIADLKVIRYIDIVTYSLSLPTMQKLIQKLIAQGPTCFNPGNSNSNEPENEECVTE